MLEQTPSPPSKKRRVFTPEEEGTGKVMGSDWKPLWELATVACWLAEEEERMKKKRNADIFVDVGITPPVIAEEEEKRKRKRKGKAAACVDVASCGKSSKAKDALGITSLVIIDDEEQRRRRRKGKAVLSADVASCSTTNMAEDDAAGITPPVVADEEGSTRCSDKTACKTLKAAPEEHVVPSTTTAAAFAEKRGPYKKITMGHPVLMGWVEKAVRMRGTRPRLVVKKKISNTDLDPHYARLPLPCSRPDEPSRGGVERLLGELSPAEGQAVHGDGLVITVLDRWGRDYDGAILKKWPSKWYVISNGKVLMRVLQGNELKAGDVVEIFSFRVPPPPLVRTGEQGAGDDGRSKEVGRLVLVVSVAEAAGEGVSTPQEDVEEEEGWRTSRQRRH